MLRVALLLSALDSRLVNAQEGRSLHWVIRVSHLETALEFTKGVLGMRVLRHEENDAACPITCNGQYDTRWSKTMVGYGREDEAYALELTYNYGVGGYEKGEGLQRFVLGVEAVALAVERSRAMGYVVHEGLSRALGPLVVGPDGYEYELRPRHSGRSEPFSAVVLAAPSPRDLAEWYMDVLGMQALDFPSRDEALQAHVGYSKDGVRLQIVRSEGGREPRISQWEGRHALALPESQVRRLSARFAAEMPHLIVHEMRELQEKLGVLVIIIVKDPSGYEICIVSSETFDAAAAAAMDYGEPDWDQRSGLLAAMSAGSAPPSFESEL